MVSYAIDYLYQGLIDSAMQTPKRACAICSGTRCVDARHVTPREDPRTGRGTPRAPGHTTGALGVRVFLYFGPRAGAGRARGRSALVRLFEGGKSLGQHVFGEAHPLGQLFLS